MLKTRAFRIILLVAVLALLLVTLRGLLPLRLFTVRGAAMPPTIHPGDLALTSLARPVNVHPGDVILFAASGQTAFSRVVRVITANGMIVTQADGRPDQDTVLVTHPQGRVLVTIPRIGELAEEVHAVFDRLLYIARRIPLIWLLED